ncbi:unnamed protein product [Acanthosepion pharaonis]|uniref:Uncharacterized protein n=1 Tax=Acanthosepion pharaonis TaxID=158019 RepID=A0A812DNM7_ACAPH|nr:unnamed protein product [Sepia pharaonis]
MSSFIFFYFSSILTCLPFSTTTSSSSVFFCPSPTLSLIPLNFSSLPLLSRHLIDSQKWETTHISNFHKIYFCVICLLPSCLSLKVFGIYSLYFSTPFSFISSFFSVPYIFFPIAVLFSCSLVIFNLPSFSCRFIDIFVVCLIFRPHFRLFSLSFSFYTFFFLSFPPLDHFSIRLNIPFFPYLSTTTFLSLSLSLFLSLSLSF